MDEQRHGEVALLQLFKESFIDFLNLLFIKNKQGEQFYKNYIYN